MGDLLYLVEYVCMIEDELNEPYTLLGFGYFNGPFAL